MTTSSHIACKVDHSQPTEQTLFLAQEHPVALIYNGYPYVVMLATPNDLEAFALGFSLAEGIIPHPNALYSIRTETIHSGTRLFIEIDPAHFHRLQARNKQISGRSGCGICGMEALQEVLRPLNPLANTLLLSAQTIYQSLAQTDHFQPLNQQTGAVHGAFWCSPDGQIIFSAEDVGRHIALDKLIGHWYTHNNPYGFAILTSRASMEIIQKAVQVGIECMVVMSAPTALAVELAHRYHLTLIGFAREQRFTIYTHPQRLTL